MGAHNKFIYCTGFVTYRDAVVELLRHHGKRISMNDENREILT